MAIVTLESLDGQITKLVERIEKRNMELIEDIKMDKLAIGARKIENKIDKLLVHTKFSL